MSRLPQEFFRQDPITVARELLGCELVFESPEGMVAGSIVETEAYLGSDDPACHSFNNRRTPRTEIMFLPGGHHYVYFIYGMYFCYNVVTEDEKSPSAVLIRAVEPIRGIPIMEGNRKQQPLKNLTNGPGKLAQAYGITQQFNGQSMDSSSLYINHSTPLPQVSVGEDHRVGIDSFGDAALWPLRFFEIDNPFVSIKKSRLYDGLETP